MGLRASLIARLNSDLQPDTRTTYMSGVKQFLLFLQETDNLAEVVELPLRPYDLLMYTEYLLQKFKPGTVRAYQCHLGYALEAMGYKKPSWSAVPAMNRVFRQLKARAKFTATKKFPVTTAMGATLVRGGDSANLDHLICSLVLMTGISGLFRLGELLVTGTKKHDSRRILRRDHVVFRPSIAEPTHMEIFLQYSKTDKYGVGTTIFIPTNPDVECCPVRLMIRWFSYLPDHPCAPIFQWPSGQLMTKSSFISWLRRGLRVAGYDDRMYAGHSLRRGGAVTAKAAGLSESMIMALGRWTSDSFKIYLKLIPTRVLHLNSLLAKMRLVQGG